MVFIVMAVVAVAWLWWSSHSSKKAAAENIKAAEAFLQANSQKEGVQTTQSGMQYLVLQKGDGSAHPKASDRVNVHYHGTLIDGTVFDSSVERGEAIKFGLNQVIKGWTEGLQLMVVGDKYRLFIPSQLGYGNRSTGLIPAGALLIFEVELLGIND